MSTVDSTLRRAGIGSDQGLESALVPVGQRAQDQIRTQLRLARHRLQPSTPNSIRIHQR